MCLLILIAQKNLTSTYNKTLEVLNLTFKTNNFNHLKYSPINKNIYDNAKAKCNEYFKTNKHTRNLYSSIFKTYTYITNFTKSKYYLGAKEVIGKYYHETVEYVINHEVVMKVYETVRGVCSIVYKKVRYAIKVVVSKTLKLVGN